VDASHPCVTRRGSFWTCEALEARGSGQASALASGLDPATLPESYESVALIPIRLEKECIGLLQLKSKKRGFFSTLDLALYEDISEALGIALSHQSTQIELRERIKEITCLYGIARVVAQERASFDEIIQAITDLLPPAWLHPGIACARIVLNGRSYVTGGFRETPHQQVSDVVVDDEVVGFVQVVYLEETPTLDDGPFLEEERNLIDSVAQEVAAFYERAKAEEEKAFLQNQLRHADRLATIGQLAAGVAHELNEPLGNILGFAQLAMRTEDVSPQVEKDLRSIESASLHAREIIKKLMAFARQLPQKKMPASLNDIVNEGIYFFEARCGKAGIELVRRLAADLPEAIIDPGQMNQVLVNLVVNAIQAMPNGGTLTVETQVADGELCLAVEDTGIGMTEEVKRQIFLPFFTTKDINEGTGLGLAVVHGIVASHNGRITVKTEQGKGARFVIHLPVTDSEQTGET
jgi:signal transduction histidine kinase